MKKLRVLSCILLAFPLISLAQEGQEGIGWIQKALMEDTQESRPSPEKKIKTDALNKLADWAKSHHLEQTEMGIKALEKSRQETLAAMAIRHAVLTKKIPESDIKLAYEKIKTSSLGKQEFKVRHLIMTSKAEADLMLQQLRTGANFAQLAKEKSADGASAAVGGEAGWLSDCMLGCNYTEGLKIQIKEVGLKKLPKTTLASPMGFFVTIVDDVRDIKPPSYESVRPGLLMQARMEKSQTILDQFFKETKVNRMDLMR